MLVLTRRKSESIQIGENVFVTILSIAGSQVRLGIEAPKDVTILRTELAERDAGLNLLGVEGFE